MIYKKIKEIIEYWHEFKGIIIPYLIICLICFIISLSSNKDNRTVSTIVEYQHIFDANDPYTENKLRNYLIQLHVKYPDVAISQMKLETNNGTSNIFIQGNNLFGMKVAVMRPTTAVSSISGGHAVYSHWRQSVLDYALWQSFVEDPENISTETNWINYISRFYSKDDSYKIKLLNIKRNLRK
jgi:hypothetical protein